MANNIVMTLEQPEPINDQLTELLRNGAKQLTSNAVEAEVSE